MPKSLRSKIKHLYYKGELNERERDRILDALDVEPCEDCISREAVNSLIDELARAISDERCYISRGRATSMIMQDILDLPSVTPQPKTGHWINYGMIPSNLGDYRWCSNCGCGIDGLEFHSNHYNYCPNCGAKMR